MFGRAVVVWFGIMVTAILNGALRDGVFTPKMGDPLARALSCVILAAVIFAVAWVTLPWMHPASDADAWRIGTVWLAMTLAFEFGVGHYLFHTSWTQLLADYNLLAGRLWIFVLAATFTAPPVMYRATQNSTAAAEISA